MPDLKSKGQTLKSCSDHLMDLFQHRPVLNATLVMSVSKPTGLSPHRLKAVVFSLTCMFFFSNYLFQTFELLVSLGFVL